MKNMKRTELYVQLKKYALVLLLLVVISACREDDDPKKDDVGEGQVTLNGGPYTNVTVKTTDFGTGGYDMEDNATYIVYTLTDDKGDSFIVTIGFPGNKTGQESWDLDGNCYIQVGHDFKGNDDYILTYGYDMSGGNFAQLPGFVKVDKYEGEGGIISGSFEGECTFVDSRCGNCIKKGTVKGTFKVNRLPDL